jgi:hypothetical protein
MLRSEAEDGDSMFDVTLGQDWQSVVPVAATAGDKIEVLRQQASGRCLWADRAGVYPMKERQGVR